MQGVRLSPEEIVRGLTEGRESPDWFFDLGTELPEFAFGLPRPNACRRVSRYSVLIGQNTATRGHYHSHDHALLCQVHGRKRVVLYEPGDPSHLYPYPVRRHGLHHEHSQVDFLNPDFEKFPNVATMRRFQTTLEPGDALFIPVHWWHAVYGIGPVLSASLLWTARFRDYRFPRPGLRALATTLHRSALSRVRSFVTGS